MELPIFEKDGKWWYEPCVGPFDSEIEAKIGAWRGLCTNGRAACPVLVNGKPYRGRRAFVSVRKYSGGGVTVKPYRRRRK
jgi:hypothetical protein